MHYTIGFHIKSISVLMKCTMLSYVREAYLASFRLEEAATAADLAVGQAVGAAKAAALATRAEVCLAREKKQEALKARNSFEIILRFIIIYHVLS